MDARPTDRGIAPARDIARAHQELVGLLWQARYLGIEAKAGAEVLDALRVVQGMVARLDP